MEGQVIAEQYQGREAQAQKLLRNVTIVHILKQKAHLRLQISATAGEHLVCDGGWLVVLLDANRKSAAKLLNSSLDQ